MSGYGSDGEFSIQKAGEGDLGRVMALIRRAVRHLEEAGIDQWDELYPDEATIRADMERGELYLMLRDGSIAALFVINGEGDPAYAEGNWRYPDAVWRVIHRLCVEPEEQGGGVGTRALKEAEAVMRALGAETVRLDAFLKNPASLRLYEKLGYRSAGEFNLRKGRFRLYEKAL